MNFHFIIIGLFLLPVSLLAVDLDSVAPPDDPESAMYTLDALCKRLSSGEMGTKRGSGFVNPPTGPIGAQGCTLNDAMNVAPIADNAKGAKPEEVLNNKAFWGLRTDGTWGPQTGTLPIQTVDESTVNQESGYYDAFDLSNVDPDLIGNNIKQGATLFGVPGAIPPAVVPQTGEPGSVGVAWPNPRFKDNDDGTVTDHLTGLMWLKDALCLAPLKENWNGAKSQVDELNSGTDLSCAGYTAATYDDWRLPTVRELQSLIHYGFFNPAIPNTAGTGQWSENQPFSGVQSSSVNGYWSATTRAGAPTLAWYVIVEDGFTTTTGITSSYYVWPVRSVPPL